MGSKNVSYSPFAAAAAAAGDPSAMPVPPRKPVFPLLFFPPSRNDMTIKIALKLTDEVLRSVSITVSYTRSILCDRCFFGVAPTRCPNCYGTGQDHGIRRCPTCAGRGVLSSCAVCYGTMIKLECVNRSVLLSDADAHGRIILPDGNQHFANGAVASYPVEVCFEPTGLYRWSDTGGRHSS